MGALFAQSAVLTPCTGGLSAICVWVKRRNGTLYLLCFPPRLTPRLGFCRRSSKGEPTGVHSVLITPSFSLPSLLPDWASAEEAQLGCQPGSRNIPAVGV